ncbi:MAG: fibronectin type III domain-containing protein [Polyangiaceae bacterium]|nr:fibronectin type III domain-containing protein [Polyangiaceae bacterium]
MFALRCGGDDPTGGSGGGGGVISDGAAGIAGQAGSGPTDTTAPVFGGVTGATSVAEHQIALTWSAATDNVTPAAQITYRIYAATTSNGHDFTQPWATAPAGSLGAVVSGLAPATQYTFVVRAVDTSNNEDDNSIKATERTKDFTAPTFAGVQDVVGLSKDSLEVSWNPATDDGTPSSGIVYRVYVAATQAGQNFSSSPTVTTSPGAAKATITGLTEATPYFVVVRAVDSDGNADTNVKEVGGETLDGTAPVFAGATGATALGTAISIAWAPATDNIDPEAYIGYRIYQATTPGGQNFTTPTYTSALGASAFTALNLNVSTTYYYVVRAVDSTGNEDTNSVEVSATTAASPDITPPVFAGLDAATPTSATTVELTWAPASDDYSQPADIVYDIFTSSTPGGQAFSTPTLTTAPGQTQHTLTGLLPLTPVHVVVRARDQAGNSDTNTVQKSATPFPDTIAPTFGGLVSVTAQGPTGLSLSWSAATDDVSPPGSIVYKVYQGSSAGGVVLTTPVVTTAPGATSANVSGLAADTTYYFIVRAVDEASNEDSNTIEKSGKTAPDTTAPTFGGATDATPQSPTSILVSWSPATDDVTPSGNIVYDVYRSTTSGGQNFTTPTATSAAGATNLMMTGLAATTTYYFVVRARDQAGNRDTNTTQVSATTPADTTPPVFAGATSVSGATNTTLTVNWAAANDNVTPPASIKYRVCWSTSPTGCTTSFSAMATVTGGTSHTVTGLPPNTSYYFVVRAEDLVGNVDTNTVVRSGATTPDVTPPTFAGAAAANAQNATTIQLTWAAATDNVTPVGSIVYDVYMALSSGGQNFAAPSFTTAAGATSFNVTALAPNTPYFFVVRARDQAGNRDSNTVQRTTSTLPDTTPPTFAGATSVTNQTETSLRVNWNAATDDTTPQAGIVYLVCWSTTNGGCNTTFTAMATTAAGALNHTATGLNPATTYYFVVRARDAFNNTSSTTTQVQGTTVADTAPPTFAGATSVSGASATTLTVNWAPATDNVTPQASIIYRICLTQSPTGCSGASFSVTQSQTGGTSRQFIGLNPTQTYYFVVRAEDAATNRDSNSVVVSGATVNDVTPPTFAGLTSATAAGATNINLLWTAATDNVSTPAQIVYDIWRATSPGGQNFAGAPQYTSAAGATSFGAGGLSPNTTYYFVARARDQAGNRDTNTVERFATTTADTTPPTFAGATSISAPTATTLTVNWSPATDNVTPQGSIVYDVCRTTVNGGCSGGSFVVHHTSAAGATSFVIPSLAPATLYYVVVRARDQANNRDGNSVQVTGTTTTDTTPPTFAGATSVTNNAVTSLRVNWAAATDNVTPAGSMVYDVCWSTNSTGCSGGSFSTMATSAAGAAFYTATGLLPTTTYYFVVRARDQAGNSDTNSVVRSGATLADTTPPTFAGATSVSGATITSLQVNWNQATDDTTSHANMSYLVCWSTNSTTCANSFSAMATVVGGLNYTAVNLVPNTTYYFVVRARDAFNNTETNTVVRNGPTSQDLTAPTGGLASSVTNATVSSLRINFTQATDNYTPQANITYRICRSTTNGGCNSSFVVWASVVGAPLYHTFTGLTLNTTYYFVVRAEDQFGNRSTNTTQVSGATLNDTTPPVWGGGPTVTASPTAAGVLNASWTAATDNYYAASSIRYHLCWNTDWTQCWDSAFTSMAITAYGATTRAVTGLANNTSYYVMVRAQDFSGNMETGNHWAMTRTLVSYSQQIWPNMFKNTVTYGSCGACHSWTRANTVNVSSGYNAGAGCGGTLLLVEPNMPQESYIYRKMVSYGNTSSPFSGGCPNYYSGVQMPQGGPYNGTNITLMRQWIVDGAPNN